MGYAGKIWVAPQIIVKKRGFIMKKTLAICLACVLLAAMSAGCGNDNDTGSSSASGSTSTSSASTSSASQPSSEPESGAGSGAGQEGDSPVELIIKDEKLKAAFDAVRKEFGEFYVSMPAVITEQQMTEMYYVNKDDVEEFVGEMSIANVSGDTFVGVKAKPGKAQAVADALEKRKNDIIENFKTYPVNFMDVKSQAAKVITQGDYVFLILMGNLNVPDGQEATLEMAQKEVERAEKAIQSVFNGADGASASESTSSAS